MAKQKINSSDYAFGVHEERLQTVSGIAIPDKKAIIRTDNNTVLSTVSEKYTVLKHEDFFKGAQEFINKIGTPSSITHGVGRGGKYYTCNIQFLDKTMAMKKGDVVGFNAYLINGYGDNVAASTLGGLTRLQCMNGMVVSGTDYRISKNHNSFIEFEWPDPEKLIAAVRSGIDVYDEYAKLDMTEIDYANMLQRAIEEKVVAESIKNINKEECSAWGLYNQMTQYVTHTSQAQLTSKIRTLNKIDSWMREVFINVDTKPSNEISSAAS